MTYLIWGALGALLGYAVYTITVEILNRTNIRDIIRSAISNIKLKHKIKGVIGDIVKEEGNYRVKVDILDSIEDEKACEVEICAKSVSGLIKGDVIQNIG